MMLLIEELEQTNFGICSPFYKSISFNPRPKITSNIQLTAFLPDLCMAEARVNTRQGTLGGGGGRGGQWATSEQRPSQSSSNHVATNHRNATTTFSSLSSSQSVALSLLLTLFYIKPSIVTTAN